ncbi:MAG: hybrid sensor histidine kinase/response regulator [Proteobacteria bacterium]|nr:hybrid sensor histidine kinase/response regulator [Pseudomonadota bacterium]MBU1688262.1 hybrid sensor histidine kinase/response regulator [Pseudomonadota bacterium]
MTFQNEEHVRIFVDESLDHLMSFEKNLLAIQDQEGEINDELINKIFRAAHSIKGGAGFLGFTRIKELAHKVENVLGGIRDRKVRVDSMVVGVLLKAVDDLGKMVSDPANSEGKDISIHIEALLAISELRPLPETGEPEQNTSPVRQTIQERPAPKEKTTEQLEPVLLPPEPGPPRKQPTAPPPSPEEKKTSLADRSRDRGGKTAGREGSVRVHVSLLDSLMNLAGELVLSRNQLLQAVASNDQVRLEAVAQRVNFVTTELQESVMLTRMQPVGKIFQRYPRMVWELAKNKGKEILLTLEGEEVELDKTIIEGISDPLTHLIRNSIDHGIETPAERVAVGKDTRGRIELKAHHEPGQVVIEINDDGRGMDSTKIIATALAKGILQEEQCKTISDHEILNLIFLPGFSTAEQVTELSGRGVGMDVVKTNLDRLGGQITIKSKPGLGTSILIKLPLTMAIISSQVVYCGDERFVIPQSNLDELLRIPAAEVKHRLEVVGKVEVLRLRGKLLPLVKLTKVLGIPPTYLEPSIEKKRRDRRISIVDRRSRRSPINESIQNEVPLGEELCPSSRRAEEDRRRSRASTTHIAIVHSGEIQYGLVINTFGDAEEIVVKSLGSHLEHCTIYSGATIMGDGRVTLILDVGNIARKVRLNTLENTGRAREVAFKEETRLKLRTEKQSLLLFRCAPDEQFAVPLNLVQRVEQIQTSAIQTAAGKKIMPYRGGSIVLFSLDDGIKVKPLEPADEMMAIIFKIAGRETALLSTIPVFSAEVRLLDIDEANVHLPAVMGSTVIAGQVTLLLNIYDLFSTLVPDWFENETASLDIPAPGGTILYAEDSNFFRNQVSSFISSAGYQILVAEDGSIAWDLLQKNRGKIDLVLTDIEMPNLNGFGLVEKIKADPDFTKIPVIALTTLAGEEDRNKGIEAGFDDYLVKLDQEKLLQGIRAMLAGKTNF